MNRQLGTTIDKKFWEELTRYLEHKERMDQIQKDAEELHQVERKQNPKEKSRINKIILDNLKIIKTKSDRETLEYVSSGKAYFAVEPLPIASYYMSKYALSSSPLTPK